jgi:hypothetical protein
MLRVLLTTLLLAVLQGLLTILDAWIPRRG